MATIHISEAQAAEDFPALMAQVRAGVEVIIESPAAPDIVVRTTTNPNLRLLSESLRIAKLRNSTVTLDGDFGRDLEEVVASYSEPIQDPWD